MKVEKKSYLSNVESLPSIKRFEEVVRKADDDLQKLKYVNATKIVVDGNAKVDTGSKDFFVDNSVKKPPANAPLSNKTLIIAAVISAALVLSIIVVIIVIVVLPILVKSNNNGGQSSGGITLTTSTSQYPTLSPTKPSFGTFQTIQNQIVDDYGRPIRLSGLNWYIIDVY